MLTEFDCQIAAWVERWKPFIRRFAHDLGLVDTTEDEWYQTARLTYWEVISQFDPSRGRMLDSFILDMLKLRLLDLKKGEKRHIHHWLRGSCPIEDVLTPARPWQETLAIDASDDSRTILRLIANGNTINSLRQIGIPHSLIQRAKDEAAFHFISNGGRNMKLREFLDARAQELGLPINPEETDLSLANRILSSGGSVRRRFKIVPIPEKRPEGDDRPCERDGCTGTALSGSQFCSVACAEAMLRETKQELRLQKERKAVLTRSVDDSAPFQGDVSPEAITGLRNPFDEGTAAFEVFEMFRSGGTKAELIARLDETFTAKGIRVTSTATRVRRVITDVRRLGFELTKHENGVFRLTGRKR